MSKASGILTAVALALSLLASSPAWANLPPGIYITDKAMDVASPTFEKDLKKQAKKTLPQADGKWHLYFVAYLSKPSPSEELNIVFYDAKAKGKQEPVGFPVTTRQGAKIVSSELTFGPENEFKVGPYDVRITQLVNGKELVLARTRLDLK